MFPHAEFSIDCPESFLARESAIMAHVRPTHTELTYGIADVLWETNAHMLEAVCDRLGMPPADEGLHPMASKRVYARNRLARVPLEQLEEIGRKVAAEFRSAELEQVLGGGGFRGVDGELKNIIFAADGPKPRIVLRDSLINVIEIVEGADRCLVYDRPLPDGGLTWRDLVGWWQSKTGEADERAAANGLYRRLVRSLESPPERLLFKAFSRRLADGAWDIPALLPQVYLHYSPYAKGVLASDRELPRQRMDFLMLPSDRERVVIEVDGKQHYAEDDGAASPARYADMVREDRAIQLAGYEVFRFGARELYDGAGERLVDDFFDQLLARGTARQS